MNIETLRNAIAEEHAVLSNHPVFASIKDIHDLRQFMEWHCFAVWDFMSLLKRLQRELTTVSVPWTPPKNVKTARLINEIVLGEETDDAPGGTHLSHYELYLKAMHDVGANSDPVMSFVDSVGQGMEIGRALTKIKAQKPVADFVTSTVTTALFGKTHEVLGSFFFGRENVIPAMFRSLLAQWKLDPNDYPMFVFYLERHIELDTESHGPAAENIIQEIVGDDEVMMEELLTSALAAVRQRRQLWDSLRERLSAELVC